MAKLCLSFEWVFSSHLSTHWSDLSSISNFQTCMRKFIPTICCLAPFGYSIRCLHKLSTLGDSSPYLTVTTFFYNFLFSRRTSNGIYVANSLLCNFWFLTPTPPTFLWWMTVVHFTKWYFLLTLPSSHEKSDLILLSCFTMFVGIGSKDMRYVRIQSNILVWWSYEFRLRVFKI